MAGVRGRSGGRRPGAGRKPGSTGGRRRGVLNVTTREERGLFERHLAAEARRLQRDGKWMGPPPSGSDADAAVLFLVRLLTTLAAKGDGRCAIHLDERLHGRVKFSLEHGGPDGGPIPIAQEGQRFKVVPPGSRPRAR